MQIRPTRLSFHVNCTMESKPLPVDALRVIFGFLDLQSLCRCCVTCLAWSSIIAHDDALWRRLLGAEFYRSSCLLSSGAWQPAGWQKPRRASAAAAAVTTAGALLDVSSAASRPASLPGRFSNSLKDLFATGLLHAAGPHQALLAQFHAALSAITAYRLLLSDNTAPVAAGPADPSATGATAAGHPTVDPCSLQPSARDPVACSNGTNISTKNTSSSSSSGISRGSYSCVVPASGYPAPVTREALRSGGWACGCVKVQQQEQSCWLRFNLPPELVQDDEEGVGALVQARRVSAVVQALGPAGWFDVAVAKRFELAQDDMSILIQSHCTGLYAWNHAEEGGVDRYGQLDPLPWDLAPGQQQQPQQQQQEQQEHQQEQQEQQQVPDAAQAAAQGQATAQQQQHGADAEDRPAPQLRMLVYIHYEQLLQALPWQLPLSVPLRPAPRLTTAQDLSMHLLSAGCALWLQLDVCQLHGGHKLGSCVVPLRLTEWEELCTFRCIEQQLLVSLYKPSSSINSTAHDPATCPQQRAIAATEGASVGAAAGASCTTGSSLATATPACSAAAQAGGAAKAAAAAAADGLLRQGDCKQVLLGSRCLLGAGQSSSDGTVISSAAEALQHLMEIDEIMVDFALFDAAGHLLLGRAGVEVWSTERGSKYMPGSPEAPQVGRTTQQPRRQASSSSAAAQPEAGDAMQSLQQHLAMVQRRQCVAAAPKDDLDDHVDAMVKGLAGCLAADPALFAETLLGVRRDVQFAAACGLPVCLCKLTEDGVLWDGDWCDCAGVEVFDRRVQNLHFVVQNVSTDFWLTCINVDAARAPLLSRFCRPRSTVSLKLPCSDVRRLFGLGP